jgi:hypothetical protein
MIKDAQGRKWLMRFSIARAGVNRAPQQPQAIFGLATVSKALAEDDARGEIQSSDALAASMEFFRRL